ncbi:ribonuclease P protein component [Sphingobium sufflavum]|uniref:ribonuclease P protein component n=1 Tax=Sphingobium sufflavum TaxID=1129547 RepID=UPI001F237E03|nr:ribonuclease P protein component [Sphingobium sufflavum]MCE7795180.1 ribonuclease P protein component [Sphingobium sufflavum]
MTRRADYLAANRGQRQTTPGFILLVRDRRDGDPAARLGITVSKKVGGAVVRNRMKRRFRVLGRELLDAHALPGSDHVLIGRKDGVERDFAALRAELQAALARAAKKAAKGQGERGQGERPNRHATQTPAAPTTESPAASLSSGPDGP